MTKFRSLVGDALRFHDTTHGALRAAVRLATRDDDIDQAGFIGSGGMSDSGKSGTMDDWSPEARAAALASRRAHAATATANKGMSSGPKEHQVARALHQKASYQHVNLGNYAASYNHQMAANEHQKAGRKRNFSPSKTDGYAEKALQAAGG